jgi:hypothetical protein
VLNNPLRYSDPTGHWADEGCGSGDMNCNNLPTSNTPATNTDKDKKDNGSEPIDKSEIYPLGYCWGYSSLVACAHDGTPLYMGDEPEQIDQAYYEEMISYLIQVAHGRSKLDLMVNAWRFDTPFYDHSFFGNGKLSGTGCIYGQCYARHEINYEAQGILWARVGVSKPAGHAIVQLWKLLPMGHAPFQSPSGGTLVMFDRGYDAYMANYPP